VLNRFQDWGDGFVREQLNRSMFLLGLILVREAKQVWRLRGEAAGQEAFRQLRRRIQADPHFQADVPHWQVHLAYIAFMLDEISSAWGLLQTAIETGGRDLSMLVQSIYATHFPLAHDRDFRALFSQALFSQAC